MMLYEYHILVSNIIEKIKTRYEKEFSDEEKKDISFDVYEQICLLHLDCASDVDAKNYKIGLFLTDDLKKWDEKLINYEYKKKILDLNRTIVNLETKITLKQKVIDLLIEIFKPDFLKKINKDKLDLEVQNELFKI